MRRARSQDTGSSKMQSCRSVVVAFAILASGCDGFQSSLAPHGPEARAIANVGWVMYAGATLILLVVMVLALYAIYRPPERRPGPSANFWIVAGGVVFPVVTLSALLAYGVHAMGAMRNTPPDSNMVQIEVVGNQWWWDVHYHEADGVVLTNANEIHIPVGQPVRISLRSADVIHSFWVPGLAGKMDLMPGRTNRLVLQADRPGLFRGQCAEFCGAQHARMALLVIAQTPEEHAAWLKARQLPPVPVDGRDLRGMQGRSAFLQHCASCHRVLGVSTPVERGPDLTHLASRKFLAAGTLPNNRENLLDFIAHSQHIKPGNAMPAQRHLENSTLHAIVDYLQSLR